MCFYAVQYVLIDEPRGERGVDTKEESLKLLDFQLFYPHYRFIKKEGNECRKVLFDFIPVEVWLDLV